MKNLPLLLALGLLAGCTSKNLEGPSLLAPPPPVAASARDVGDAWRWFLDAGRVDGAAPGAGANPAAGTPLAAGLLVDVVSGASLPTRADSSVLAEGSSTPVPVGGGVWPRGAYRSPYALDAGWEDAKVAVEWSVCARRHGDCTVDVTAVPRLLHCDGRVAELTELTIRRTLSFEETIVIAVDPNSPLAATGRLLVGAAPGRPGKLLLRVRG